MSPMPFLVVLVGAKELFPNFRRANSIPSSLLRHSKFRKFLIAATVGPTVNTDIN